MDLGITGKRALVTGGSLGIGRAVAEELAREGCDVAMMARTKETLRQAADEIARATNRRVVAVPADASVAGDVTRAVEEATQALGGPIDILVNNAGLTRDNILLRLSEEDWDTVLDANLKGAFHTTRAVLKGMMKKRAGRIINITSVVGITGNKGQANYAASKAGLIGFTKSVAKEYAGRGILANCIAPGFIDTDMTGALTEEQKASINANIPLGRTGKPEEIAAAVVYLASDEAAYITGQTLRVNGGMYM